MAINPSAEGPPHDCAEKVVAEKPDTKSDEGSAEVASTTTFPALPRQRSSS